jgi:hypothetical protein
MSFCLRITNGLNHKEWNMTSFLLIINEKISKVIRFDDFWCLMVWIVLNFEEFIETLELCLKFLMV